MTYATDYVARMHGAYVVAALWTGLDYDDMRDGNPTPMDEKHDADDIAPEAMQSMWDDVVSFYVGNADDLARAADVVAGYDAEQAGHDFLLTRNHHGAGFWDRGLGEIGERLTDNAHPYGEQNLYVGDDGRLYV